MPNFITKELKKINLPLSKDGIRFYKKASCGDELIIFTANQNENFLLTVKKRDENYLVKGYKGMNPSKTILLQEALELFSKEFCKEIVSSAFRAKKSSLKSNSAIKTKEEILEILQEKKKVALEIGFGSGRHLLYRAKDDKECFFVGVEIYKPAIKQVSRQIELQSISNLALIDIDARLFLELLCSNSLSAIYLHFPVPWDDAPHRRVVSGDFLNEALRVLKKGAKFELRSDSREYTIFTFQEALKLDGIAIECYKNHDLAISSKYEDRWKRKDKDIYDLKLTKEFDSQADSDKLKIKFDFKIDYNAFAKEFKKERLKFENFFVLFDKLYEIDGGGYLLKVAMGAFDKPQNRFIILDNDTLSYFPKEPIPTKESFLAHTAIQQRLKKWQKS